MAKIQRNTQKIFGNNAPADDIAVLGSFKTGTPVYTDNIAALQNTAYEQGYGAALVADEAPFLEEQNSIPFILSKQLAYIFQEGIAEYDIGTTYYKGSWCKAKSNNVFSLYESLTDENIGNPLSDETHWKPVQFGSSSSDTIPLFTALYFDFTPNSVNFLKAGQQQNNAGIYETVYNTLVSCLTNNIYNLKVISTDNMSPDTDYSEYWQVNQDAMWFKTPTRISGRTLVARKEPTASDKSWYNLYSDGWCEQGGSLVLGVANTMTPVTLQIPYTDSNYAVLASNSGEAATMYNVKVGAVELNTNTTVYLAASNANTGVNWETAGYTKPQAISQLYFKVANAVENLELLNAGVVMETLSHKADINSNVMDGQITFSPQNLIETGTIGTYSADLSNILPSDGQIYEVQLRVTSYYTSSSAHAQYIGSDIAPLIIVNEVTATSAGSVYTYLWLPVGAGRKIDYELKNKNVIESGVQLLSYRRVGTNE